MTGVTKAVAYFIPVCGMVHIKDPLLLIKKSCPCRCDSGFPIFLFSFHVVYLVMTIFCLLLGSGSKKDPKEKKKTTSKPKGKGNSY